MKRLVLFIGAFSVLQFACNNADTNSGPMAEEKMKIKDQGVNIAYDDSKNGDTTILFIHGWGINRTYWENQVSFFAPKYRIVTIDLPGFGESGKNRKSWAVEDYERDITTLITALELKNIILVGHSMSGTIIVETALTNPARVIGIVGVDNFKNFGYVETPASKAEAARFYEAARTHYKQMVYTAMDQELFAPSTDSLIRKRVLHDIVNADSTIAVDILERADGFPLSTKLVMLKKKLYLINSDYIPTDTAAFKKGNIDYALLNIGATGHYPMLEKPHDFNLLLQQIIDRLSQ